MWNVSNISFHRAKEVHWKFQWSIQYSNMYSFHPLDFKIVCSKEFHWLHFLSALQYAWKDLDLLRKSMVKQWNKKSIVNIFTKWNSMNFFWVQLFVKDYFKYAWISWSNDWISILWMNESIEYFQLNESRPFWKQGTF